jgi:quinol monooxygenase YgiN
VGTEVSFLVEGAVKPGRLDDVRAVMDELVESTTAEPGALGYTWSLSEDATVLHLMERYVDSAAALAHLETFGSRFAGRYFDAVEPTRFVVYGGDDSVAEALAAAQPLLMGPLVGLTR